MLSKELFQKILASFAINFGFELKGDDGRIYKSMVYEALKNKVDDERFSFVANGVLEQTTLKDWNEAYGYKGKPSLADWLETFKPKMIEKTEYYKCDITGAMLAKRVLVQENQQLKIK
jgi:hypothetical protein